MGNEYGMMMGCLCCCGWFDVVVVKYMVWLSGVNCFVFMMLDVLSELEEIKVCVVYEIDGCCVDKFFVYVDSL